MREAFESRRCHFNEMAKSTLLSGRNLPAIFRHFKKAALLNPGGTPKYDNKSLPEPTIREQIYVGARVSSDLCAMLIFRALFRARSNSLRIFKMRKEGCWRGDREAGRGEEGRGGGDWGEGGGGGGGRGGAKWGEVGE